jgi:predicted DNA-binding transcriptional regulator AlpA
MATLNEATKSFDALPDAAHVPAKTAAAILGMSEASIWRMVKAGRLTAKKIGERATRFNVGEIRKLIAA